jgi:hypothetical protein
MVLISTRRNVGCGRRLSQRRGGVCAVLDGSAGEQTDPQHPDWRARFDTLVIQVSIPGDLWSIRSDIPKITRRAIGRYIGYYFWKEGSSTDSNISMKRLLQSSICQSEEVRLGAYDWLSYGAFESISNMNGA